MATAAEIFAQSKLSDRSNGLFIVEEQSAREVRNLVDHVSPRVLITDT